MDMKDLIEEASYISKRKAATHGGEYCSPCPFCKDGDDRFLIWPLRHNNNGDYQGGRYSCRVCGKYGDAITFLRELHGLGYLEACTRLRLEPKQRSTSMRPRLAPKPRAAEEPSALWKEKATVFVNWCYTQLVNDPQTMSHLEERKITQETVARFKLGYNPQSFFRDRSGWGLAREIKDDGKERKLWLPAGIVIPTFEGGQAVKVKVRRSDWKEGDQWPKYIEISGSKQALSIYGDTSLSGALVIESELDALLVLQEAGDLVYCVALGGSTKPIDFQADQLLRKTQLILFLPDFDKAGAIAWSKWENMFPNIQRILSPYEKSAGDYFQAGGDLRIWLEASIKEIKRKAKGH